MIWDQFNAIYNHDPAMRKLISEKEVAIMSLEEKYHIITAYMRGGGVQALLGDEYDDDMGDLTEDEKVMVEEEFEKLYKEDSRFRLLIEETELETLNLRDTYELIVAYSKRNGGASSDAGSNGFGDRRRSTPGVEVDGQFVTYKGKRYKRV